MRNLLVKNVNNSGLDTLICDTTLEPNEITLTLIKQNKEFDNVEEVEKPQYIPDTMSVMWFTPRGEYELRRELASANPELADAYPEWEVLHPKKRKRSA